MQTQRWRQCKIPARDAQRDSAFLIGWLTVCAHLTNWSYIIITNIVFPHTNVIASALKCIVQFRPPPARELHLQTGRTTSYYSAKRFYYIKLRPLWAPHWRMPDMVQWSPISQQRRSFLSAIWPWNGPKCMSWSLSVTGCIFKGILMGR